MGAPMTERIPAEVFPPGEVIKEELEARGWSQVELSEIMGRPPRVVSEIVSGKRAITAETAKGLGAAFGTGATFWVNLEGVYRLSRTAHDDEAVERRARLYAKVPVKEMIKRHWIRPSDSVSVLEAQVADFLEIGDIREEPRYALAARKGATESDLSGAQWAWFFRVRQIARSISVPRYSEKALRGSLAKLESLLRDAEEARHVPRILMECGVRFVIVEKLTNADIDGVCFWLDDQSPVIGMSTRRDKIDNFWFVLRHEIEHVLRKHGQTQEIIDADLERDRASTADSLPEEERVANTAAAEFCVPVEKLESFMKRKHPFYYERDVVAFARLLNRHPGLVAGQMQLRLGRSDYLTKRLVKIRQFVLPEAIADGWGQEAPVSI
jgi:HTH-type transcriptional regulator / antitoxin HigA